MPVAPVGGAAAAILADPGQPWDRRTVTVLAARLERLAAGVTGLDSRLHGDLAEVAAALDEVIAGASRQTHGWYGARDIHSAWTRPPPRGPNTMPRRAAPHDPSIGERIRTRRELRGWSIRHAASRAGVAHTTWSRVERGELRTDRYMVADLAAALECAVSDLTGQPFARPTGGWNPRTPPLSGCGG